MDVEMEDWGDGQRSLCPSSESVVEVEVEGRLEVLLEEQGDGEEFLRFHSRRQCCICDSLLVVH